MCCHVGFGGFQVPTVEEYNVYDGYDRCGEGQGAVGVGTCPTTSQLGPGVSCIEPGVMQDLHRRNAD